MRFSHLLPLLLGVVLLAGCSSASQTVQPPSGPPAAASGGDESDFDKAIAKSDTLDGLFTVYRDTTDGSVHLALHEDQIGKEYIFFTQTLDGVPDVGHARGTYRDDAVFTIRRYYDRIEFVEVNTNYYANEESALSRAAGSNISPSVLHVEKIVARDTTDSRILIEGDNLFLTQALHQVAPSRFPGSSPFAFRLGRQSKSKTKIASVHNYPENTDVVVDYIFDNPKPINRGSDAVTDARSVTITMRHSLVEMPDNDFEPRFADPRVGYFSTAKDDLTSTSATPYHDLINRWNLVKANPDAEMSEPVEPIVWWIENTTPERIRPIIRDAVLEWNTAFEAAGFRNAVQVKVQPDTASWDAGDIRYNVLRWTASPNLYYGGYGPSFVNPRTGQIMGADVMLVYAFLSNRVNYNQLFDTAAMPSHTPTNGPDLPPEACTLGAFLQENLMFGRTALKALGPDNEQNGPSDLEGEMTQLLEEGIYYLALHEVGHTLGLSHNMKASTLHGMDRVHDEDYTREVGLTGSVMDYPAINVAAPGQSQGQYYTTRPGPYDMWAIQYGYSDASEDELEDLLSRSTEPELAFGNDADDMRSPGRGIDPRVMIGDMTNEPIEYAEGRMALIQSIMSDLMERYEEPGQSYEEFRNAFLILTGQHARMMGVASRFIGGVYVDRAFIGQEGATEPHRPVSAETQAKAMNLLAEELFAPDAFDYVDAEVYRHLQRQRRGFTLFGSQDPQIHARFLGAQRRVLAHLLHPNTVERISDTRLYGNEYPLAAYMEDLTNAIFEADARTNVNTFRQNLQLAYVTGLTGVLSEEGREQYDYLTQSAALQSLRQIEDLIDGKRGVNAETRAHTEHVLLLIDKATSVD